jgi:hypothetical protein
MHNIYLALVGMAALGIFFWLLWGNSSTPPKSEGGSELIDPSDSRLFVLVWGVWGGPAADAAIARFALERFEKIHGRKATTRDVGIVVGLMRGGF